MKKRDPFYELSDEPIGVQMSKTQLEKHLQKVRVDIKKALARSKATSSAKKLTSK
jgi:hypothetical protein